MSDGADGTVTFFDADKGFGFARPDAGGEDVFVHAKNLVGTVSLAEGDRISFTVAESDRGPQAQEVRLVGGQARRQAPAAGRGRSERPRSSGAPARGGQGTVARYDAERGFGFITPDAGGDDLFVHVSVVRGSDGLYEGDRVRYEVRQSDRGPQADRVELI
ncbi:cold shock domain-containing protein [Cellulomonas sp. zg-Y766]|uniref:Cold shock domain-containing protein n=1 Tax=Cellulomonas wangsupingiae TaxID=2968085 RepID=A0ABY5K9I0_9CELL|nr:cold shock domain-containing protein [Cellulomonas wangsupingiae]MCM0638877.1 cold shock domain-containing protein [Cellulomonas wangsupingiae]UUI66929.1 cold shock domain-containing protein [Cellulomonas wangsupingiae]